MATVRAPSSAARRPAARPARSPTVTLPPAPGPAAQSQPRCCEPTVCPSRRHRCSGARYRSQAWAPLARLAAARLSGAVREARQGWGVLPRGHAHPFLLPATRGLSKMPPNNTGAGAEGRGLRRSPSQPSLPAQPCGWPPAQDMGTVLPPNPAPGKSLPMVSSPALHRTRPHSHPAEYAHCAGPAGEQPQ